MKLYLILSFFFILLYLNLKIFEYYDESGYDNTRYLHCSDSSELNHRNRFTGEPVSGYGLNNNYFVEDTDITYTGGTGDFSKFLDVYKLRTEPPALQAPICMHKTSFENNLHIPSFFRQIYEGGDSSEILEIEKSYEDLIHDPFYKYRGPLELKNRLILDDKTNDMILRQHAEISENKPHNNHIELNAIRKTCSNHDSLGNKFECGLYREFNIDNAMRECVDDSLSNINCNKICCNGIQESFNIR